MLRKNLSIIAVGFVGGIFVRSIINIGPALPLFFLALSISFYITQFYFDKFSEKTSRIYLLSILMLASFTGVLWFNFMDGGESARFENLVGKRTVLRGVISEEPDERESYTFLTVESGKTKILVKSGRFPRFNYGDEVELNGIFGKPKNISAVMALEIPSLTPDASKLASGGSLGIINDSFDYISYLAKDGIYYEMDKPGISLVSSRKGSFIKQKLFELKDGFMGSIKTILPEPESSLLGGLLVGAKESLGKDLINKFRDVGLIHTVVLSGYNITIIADAVIKFFLTIFSVNISIALGSASIVLFALMTGGAAATMRATLMSLVVMTSRATGRLYSATSALIFAGLLMIMQNPKILVFDTSFQLSFLATLGLIYLSDPVKGHLEFLPDRFDLRGIVATTISAQIATMPLILYKMGMLSIVALPVNVIVVGFIPLTMFFGFLAATINFISYYLALPFIFLSHILLAYELFVVEIFSSIPFASIAVSNFSLWFMILSYILIIFYLFYLNFGKNDGVKTKL